MASNAAWRYGRFDNSKPVWYRMPFMPLGAVSFTPFTHGLEGPANHAVLGTRIPPRWESLLIHQAHPTIIC
jgi:hypothetical protein